jgi:predicted acetyltransferase
MAPLRLVFPEERHRESWHEFLREWKTTGIELTPGALDPCQGDFDAFLDYSRRLEAGFDLPPGKVRSGLFLLVGDDGVRIVGAVSIRYELNDYLLNYGGNIGYGVRPSERRKGYGKRMLALALDVCRTHGLSRALVTCDATNEASARTILANGGRFENEVVHPDGEPVRRYWIQL